MRWRTPKPVAPPARIEAQPASAAPQQQISQAEQDELAAALAELEAQEQQEQARMKR